MRRKISPPTAAAAAMTAQARTAALRPVRTWAFSAKYRSQPLMRSTHRRRTRAAPAAPASPAPHRAEQESDAERHRQRGVGPRPERLVDRIDHLVADLLDGIDGVLALGADVGHHALDVGS